MKKPLGPFTIYPKMGSVYIDEPGNRVWASVQADAISCNKRLTDAELAAEYYAQDAKCRHEHWIETVRGDDDYTETERAAQSQMYEWLSALHRFATLPHYDEAQS